MKHFVKILFILLIFSILLPSVQANIFDDIENIRKEITETNEILVEVQTEIEDLTATTHEMDKSLVDVVIKLDDLTKEVADTIGLIDEFRIFVKEIKTILLFGISTIIIGIITLIICTIVLAKYRKKNNK